MRIRVVNAHTQDYDALLNVLRLVALKVMRLDGAAAREVFRIKVQNHPLAAIVLETNGRPLLGRKGELWRGTADRRQCSCTHQQGPHPENQDHQTKYRNRESLRHYENSCLQIPSRVRSSKGRRLPYRTTVAIGRALERVHSTYGKL